MPLIIRPFFFAATLLLATEFPLTVGRLVTGPNSHLELTNTANQPITAWALVISTRPDPGRTHREVWTVDGYLSEATGGLPGRVAELERLMPGETREVRLDPLPAEATVDVVAVVMDDATAKGDESVIASIFDRRVHERDALQAVAKVFHDVLSSERGATALAMLRDRLTALVQRDSSVPCRAALEAVESYQQRAVGSRSSDDVDQSLQRYAAFVTEELQLAAKHSRRSS